MLGKFVHQVGSIYKRLYKAERSAKHKIVLQYLHQLLLNFLFDVI